MFKASRWRGEKNKIKAVFKFQFQASQVSQLGWETMMVTLVPVDVGRPSTRSENVAVVDGSCRWAKPVLETVKLTQDPKSGKINEKIYQFIVSATGLTKAGLLGEATMNLADYAEVLKPSSVVLPLRPTNTGAVLQVTVQRVHGEIDRRETDENGDSVNQQQHRTLMSHLSNSAKDESPMVTNGRMDDSATDGATVNNHAESRNHSGRTLPLRTSSDITHSKSCSADTISALGSDCSSERYTPRESDSRDWSMSSVLDGSVGGSTNSSGENGWRERLYDPDVTLERLRSDAIALARQVELSSIELQTLRKQVIKESRRGQELLKELTNLKDERDAIKKEYYELKRLKFEDEDPRSTLEEMKEELNHEKNVNGNLRLQLQKTQEANSGLIIAVRDLEELLVPRKEFSSCCTTTVVAETDNDLQVEEDKYLRETIIPPENDIEQYELEEIVKEHVYVTVGYSIEKQLIDLKTEVELYRKDGEELEMQMEQLALDYEILKQENHDISSKLEQTQLREQLRLQYECSAHLAIINDLETQVENLEKELAEQAEGFEADIETMVHEKVEQEKRAIQAEDAVRTLRRKNAKTTEHLQEELTRLSAKISNTFYANEKLAMQVITEASELRSEKCHLQAVLDKANEELTSAQTQFLVNLQELLHLLDEKTGEIDMLKFEINKKNEELENHKKSDNKAAVEELLKEKESLSIQLKDKDMLHSKAVSMQGDATILHEQLGVLKLLEKEKDDAIRLLIFEKEILQLENSELKDSFLRCEVKQENLKPQVFHSNKEQFGVQGNNVEVQRDNLEEQRNAFDRDDKGMESLSWTGVSTCYANGTLKNQNTSNDGDAFEEELETSSPCYCGQVETSEVSSELAVLMERNKCKEAELKELQERYSDISLKFAEVEGERQQLVMMIRMLKNSMKN